MRTTAKVEVGDVVVRPGIHNGTLVYVLNTAPRPGQMFVRSREAAVVHAVRFATAHGVRAWMAEEAGHMVLLFGLTQTVGAVCRPATSVTY